MSDNEVIGELEYYRDMFKTMYERMDRFVKSLSAAPAPPTHIEYDRSRMNEPPPF